MSWEVWDYRRMLNSCSVGKRITADVLQGVQVPCEIRVPHVLGFVWIHNKKAVPNPKSFQSL